MDLVSAIAHAHPGQYLVFSRRDDGHRMLTIQDRPSAAPARTLTCTAVRSLDALVETLLTARSRRQGDVDIILKQAGHLCGLAVSLENVATNHRCRSYMDGESFVFRVVDT